MFGRGVVYLHFEEVHSFFLLQDLIYIILSQREVFKELKALTEAVDGLLEMLSNEGHGVSSDLVDDASIGHDSLTSNTHEIYFRHYYSHCTVHNDLAGKPHLLALLLNLLASITGMGLCGDYVNLNTILRDMLQHI